LAQLRFMSWIQQVVVQMIGFGEGHAHTKMITLIETTLSLRRNSTHSIYNLRFKSVTEKVSSRPQFCSMFPR
jgi:hypothetical protein